MVRGLGHMSCKESGRELAWVRLGKHELMTACRYLKGRYQGDGAKLFLAVADTITRGSVHRLQLGRFRLDFSPGGWCSAEKARRDTSISILGETWLGKAMATLI